MNSFLLDSRVLVERCTFQPGSGLLDALFAPGVRERLVCPWLSVADFAAELNRLRRRGSLTAMLFGGALFHLHDQLLHPSTVEKLSATGAAVQRALSLLEAYPLKAVDGIVLRLALDAAAARREARDDLVLVSTDRGLLRAARREGLLTFNPKAQAAAVLATLIAP
jgi:hypothetical protein